jgi:hypothetical protein
VAVVGDSLGGWPAARAVMLDFFICFIYIHIRWGIEQDLYVAGK